MYIESYATDSNDINATNNEVSCHTTLGFQVSYCAYFSFGIFVNNTADALFCIWLPAESPILKYSKFISSKRLQTSYSLFHYSSEKGKNAIVTNCSFFDNFKPLFQYGNKQIEISNCICDEYSYDTSRVALITKNIITTSNYEKISLKNYCTIIHTRNNCSNIKRSRMCSFVFIIHVILSI